jgi:molybdate transport system ATP-binding protein
VDAGGCIGGFGLRGGVGQCVLASAAESMSGGIEANFVKRFSGGPEIRVESLRTREQAAVTVLFGPSGAGKTTVLRCLAGLMRPEEGKISFDGQAWSDVERGFFLPVRQRNVGFVPQEYALFPHLSVERNIAYGLNRAGRDESRSRVAEMIKWLALEGLEKRLPKELSGGQQQRVALARAVARRPNLLLLDEPLAALDAPTRQRLRGELRRLLKEAAVPSLLVTHDRTDALVLGDDLVVMNEGCLMQQGPVHEVFSRPANLAVAGIVAVETVQPARVLERGDLATLAVGEQRLLALAVDLPSNAKDVYVCIRAEDVILIKGEPVRSSPRNCLTAVVRGLSPEGPMVRIDLDCSFPLSALLTRQACEELDLKAGERVLALVKAPNVHLIPRTV